MATNGNLLTRSIGRGLLAICVDLPYALEKPLLRRLLHTPVFEPATPTQLSSIAVFPSRDTAKSAADGVPSVNIMMPAVNVRGNDTLKGPAFSQMAAVLSPVAARLPAARSEL